MWLSRHGIQGNKNQEYQGSDGAVEGGDPKGYVHTIEEMKAWLQAFGYSDAINDAAINFILREFVMSKVSCDEMSNMDMIVELLRSPLGSAASLVKNWKS